MKCPACRIELEYVNNDTWVCPECKSTLLFKSNGAIEARPCANCAELERRIKDWKAAFSGAAQTVYHELIDTCGETLAKAAYHAVKNDLRLAVERIDGTPHACTPAGREDEHE